MKKMKKKKMVLTEMELEVTLGEDCGWGNGGERAVPG